MPWPPHANQNVVKDAQAIWEAANDYKEGVQQRTDKGTTTPDIANMALEYVEEVTRQLKPLEEKAKKKRWKSVSPDVVSSLNRIREGISQSQRDFQEKSDEEMERRKREAEQTLISRPIMAHSDREKWIAEDKLRNIGKSASTSSPSGLPLPPGRTKQYTTSAATRTSTESRRAPSIDWESVSQASSAVPHSEHSEEDTDDDSEEPYRHSYPSSTTLPRHEIFHDINALIIVC
ncbi:hypothetical protein JB92DRAFT_3142075 [Gautieria morchelliformis]|nr:hypothetical protein JB92DRAFT_3142075 [Gautieria morchelliformis]